MRLGSALISLSFATLAATGCRSCCDPEDPKTPPEPEVAAPPDPQKACPGTSYVGIRSAASCPAPAATDPAEGQWIGRDLFEPSTPPRNAEVCAYNWQPSNSERPSAAATRALLALAQGAGAPLRKLDETCAIVVPLADSVTTKLLPAARAAFRAQVDAQNSLPRGVDQPAPIHVAVVDTLPDDGLLANAFLPEHVHGRTVGLVIQDLACPSGPPCPVRLSSHLAFGRPGAHSQNREGAAMLGTQDDLANSIQNALHSWLKMSNLTREKRLVINLSLGWSGTMDVNTASTAMDAASFSVWSSIAEASCHGALVVSAAGNATNGGVPGTGPMFPAAWEKRSALTDAECQSQFGFAPPAGSRTGSGPLLISAGGLDGFDRPVSNVRPGARPRIGASAQHVAVEDQSVTPPFFSVMTGSSMSAAVTSAAAAIAWSYRPEETSAQIAALIYDGSVQLGEDRATYCQGGSSGCGDVHRISICKLLQQTCPSGRFNNRCPSTVSCTIGRAYRSAPIDVTDADVGALETAITTVAPTPGPWVQNTPAVCGDPVMMPAGSTAQPCPARQFYNAVGAPAVYPQPEGDPCRICFLRRKVEVAGCNQLFVSINPNLPSDAILSSPSLTIGFGDGSTRIYDVSAIGAIAPGQDARVCVPLEAGPAQRGTISFVVQPPSGSKYSSTSPLVID